MPKGPPETKVFASSATSILTTLVAWVLVTTVPAFKTGIPEVYAVLIPGGVAWLLSSYAAWRAPHTHRPELLPGLEEALTVSARAIAANLATSKPSEPEVPVTITGTPLPPSL